VVSLQRAWLFLGGAFSKPTGLSEDPNVNQILLDLRQNNTLKESFWFAEMILATIGAITPVKFSSYRQANFVVLRAPDIPTVLIETAFITNREDEGLLKRDDYQEKLAWFLSSTVVKYFYGSGS